MLVLNLPFKALMFLTLMRPSLVLFLVLWLKLVKDFLKVRCRSEERFSRNAETDLVCRLLLEKKKETIKDIKMKYDYSRVNRKATTQCRKKTNANGIHLEVFLR